MLRPPYLRATAFVVGLGFFAQLTGINGIIYYSPLLFEAMGFQGNFALLVLPALVQLASLAAVLASLVLVDRIGRRPILLSGIAAMILGDAVLIGVFAAKSSAVSRARLCRSAAVHDGVHLRIRGSGLGLRR